jgi:hypothetical protein
MTENSDFSTSTSHLSSLADVESQSGPRSASEEKQRSAAPTESVSRIRRVPGVGQFLRQYAIFLILAVLILFFQSREPAFLRINNLFSVLQSVAVVALLGIGVTVTLAVDGFDLSVGSIAAFTLMLKKENPGIAEKAVWGAVDSNTATTVASQTAAVLRAHPEIKVVFAPYDEFARGVKLGAVEAGVADKIKVYSADVSTSDIQDIREDGSPWVATSATNPAVVGEVSLRAVALLIAGQDPGKVIEVNPVLITQEELNKNNIKTIADLDAKWPGFGHSDQATASWLSAARIANSK